MLLDPLGDLTGGCIAGRTGGSPGPDEIVDAALGDVLLERVTPRGGRVSTFVSLGLGVEDVATAAALVGS